MAEAPSSRRTVLVVEDNPGDARLVELFLREETADPFRILKAGVLADALTVLTAEHVDVVLLDLSLPDSFGLATLASVKSVRPLVPVVVLTGTKDEMLALEALRRGAQDYLVKGGDDGELLRRAIRYAIERSRVEVALRLSEDRFRAVFQNAGVGVLLSAADGRFLQANPAFCTMVGYAEDELVGRCFEDISHPEDAARNRSLRDEMLAGGRESYNLTKRYIAKDGRVVWGRMTVTMVRGTDDDDEAIRFTVTVVEDVTERKRLEDHMRLAATVFENSGDGLFVTDDHCNIVHVNPAFSEITGFEPEDVLGKTPKVLSSGRHGPDFYERMWESLRNNGKWQGEIWDRRKSGEMFAGWQNIAAVRNSLGEITNYVAVISDITSRKQVEERLSYQANHDPLTRLPNRTLFHERLSRAVARAHRNQSLVALLFIDLDHFKEVNDTLGHLAGDMLLQQVAERLTGATRQGDTVARLAGDEFTVILEDVQDPRDAAVVAHKILHMLVEDFDLAGHVAHISSSIGVALYPVDAGDSQTLIKLADAAMYRAKHLGRNGCQFHSEAVNAQAFERLALENALHQALDRGEFAIHYQPIFDFRTGRVVAVEALLRWRHPEVGMVVPGQFIALADETGLIVSIGRWVLKAACTQVKAWRDAGYADLSLHVNVSGRQLREPGLVEQIAEALEQSGLPPSALVLEVPEASALDKGHDPGAIFARFTALGLGLTIDEFGSGYSSFAFLRRLPANALKVSQGFVRNVANSSDDSEIVTAIVAVARGLHMNVIAPGVETPEQLSFLASFGCDQVQGFLLARPMPADEATAFLARPEPPTALVRKVTS
ncbi:EAL domain-containing protein [Magnetospirillum aberrantis]|uniref:EAL domain-containing protein n=1 Tax=Magnetospirillum aberrantis SpK TaxID=908842 RepID=A0A7C9UU10_9PROT|nr:EAL domain-containing protein [Magnetospirillum aberrantis]NFV80467.1 EAL domain-containing protein [Magnetospirillum aberrantis SpK]